MQYKNVVEAIYIHLDEVQQIVAKFGTEEKLRDIDIDLSMDKLRDVYDLLGSLRGGGQDIPVEVAKDEILVLDEEEVEPRGVNKPVEIVKERKQEKTNDIAGTEEDSVEQPEPKGKLGEKKEETQAEIHSRVKSKVQNLGDKFHSDKPSLNEELSHSTQKVDLSSRLKVKPINSIKDAIGLNEKFELIQSLFNGDSQKYEQTMNVLNMATRFNEAYDYLASHYNWDMDSPLVQRILELIRRKLIVGKNG